MAQAQPLAGTHSGIDQLLYVLGLAFEGREHGLLTNLQSVPDEAWTWVPSGGARSVFDIVRHVGECKYVYDNQCFGDGSMAWDRPGSVPAIEAGTPRQTVVDWLRRGHEALRGHIQTLKDDGVLAGVRTFFNRPQEIRWFINEMIQHDLYHAGEINHVRSLYEQRDRWAYELD